MGWRRGPSLSTSRCDLLRLPHLQPFPLPPQGSSANLGTLPGLREWSISEPRGHTDHPASSSMRPMHFLLQETPRGTDAWPGLSAEETPAEGGLATDLAQALTSPAKQQRVSSMR